MSIQKSTQKYSTKIKYSTNKEINNLTIKNSCFGEIEYSSITQKMRDKALLLLIFRGIKRNRELKSRGYANRSFYKVYINKEDVLLLMPDFYAFKYICATISKEKIDLVTMNLLDFFIDKNRGL